MDLKVARQIARLTQQQLADRAGVDASAISLIENDKREYSRASYATIIRISRALNVDPEVLFPLEPVAPTAQESAPA